MVFTLSPPPALLLIGIGIFLVLLIAALRGRGSRMVRLVRLGIGSVIIVVLLVVADRPATIRVDDTGITSPNGGGVAIPWQAVTTAAYVADLASSSYRPTAKLKGIELGSYRVGSFKTSSGRDALVIATSSAAALVIDANHRLYLFAPPRLDAMVEAAARHVTVAGWKGPTTALPSHASS